MLMTGGTHSDLVMVRYVVTCLSAAATTQRHDAQRNDSVAAWSTDTVHCMDSVMHADLLQ